MAERRRSNDGDAAKELEGAKASLSIVEKKLDKLVAAFLEGKLAETDNTRRHQADLEAEKERLVSIIRLNTAKLKQHLAPIAFDQLSGWPRS